MTFSSGGFSLFGGTSSKDVVSDMINSSISVINTSVQDCKGEIIEQQGISVVNCPNINIHDINFSEGATIDITCISTNDFTSNVDTLIAEQMTQSAKAVKDTFLPDLSNTSSENYTCLVQNLAQTISNKFAQNCNVSLVLDQTVTCKNSANADIYHIDFKQFSKTTSSCVMNNTIESTASTAMQTFLDQHSSSLSTDPLADLAHDPLAILGMLLVAALFILAPIMEGEYVVVKAVSSPWFWIAAVALTMFLVYIFAVLLPNQKRIRDTKAEAAATAADEINTPPGLDKVAPNIEIEDN